MRTAALAFLLLNEAIGFVAVVIFVSSGGVSPAAHALGNAISAAVLRGIHP